ncbi:MAG: c(7)-type cytochrome triheme domain-containing protein [Gammaproteobacteria bacterium]
MIQRKALIIFLGTFLLATFGSIVLAARDVIPPPLTAIVEDGVHDPEGAAASVLQNPRESMKNFPKDKRGEVDWVKTLDKGVISPRKSRTNDEWETELMKPMDLDIIMKQTRGMPHVRFPHLAHTKWLACSNCHPKIFIPQYNANPINMNEIIGGKFCGRCHDKVSFSLWTCERCHSVPHDGSPGAWW